MQRRRIVDSYQYLSHQHIIGGMVGDNMIYYSTRMTISSLFKDYLCMYPSIYPCIHYFIYPFIDLFITSIPLSLHLSTHPSIYQPSFLTVRYQEYSMGLINCQESQLNRRISGIHTDTQSNTYEDKKSDDDAMQCIY